MADYLKKYLDRVGDVPAQLHRLFMLIRDLDERVTKLQEDVETMCRAQLHHAAQKGKGDGPPTKRQRTGAAAQLAGDAAAQAEIEAGMQKLQSLSEEKIKIACQVYDYVDGHIRQLDEDLKAFDDEISADKASAGLGDEAAPAPPKPGKARGSAAAAATGEVRQKRKYTRRKGVTAPAAALSAGASSSGAPSGADAAPPAPGAVDSSEPRYCVCHNVSYGNMILCDNKDCEIEWFHVGCVGVSLPHKGAWYCSPTCEAAAKAKEAAA